MPFSSTRDKGNVTHEYAAESRRPHDPCHQKKGPTWWHNHGGRDARFSGLFSSNVHQARRHQQHEHSTNYKAHGKSKHTRTG
ncbi:hypothetical protein AWB81_07073 [Caballeronia arationis]|uniref:Uncharacterized protein n=1 Tax=Caballeronia arationis TaxID=1777142 RepID=A0A7Z7I4S1_9BURK|nr:hypothetical protein AWB81_07073 [Caballeronia arationis]SOE62688.1 hypothetical protein SAMN05446927_2371 [Caballeronia arationis]